VSSRCQRRACVRSRSVDPASASNVGQKSRCGRSLAAIAVARLSACGAGGGLASSVAVAGSRLSAHDTATVTLPSESQFLVGGQGQVREFVLYRRVSGRRVQEALGQERAGWCSACSRSGGFASVQDVHDVILARCWFYGSKIIVWPASRSVSVLWCGTALKRWEERKESHLSSENQHVAARCRECGLGAAVPSAVHGLVFVVNSAQDGQEKQRAALKAALGKHRRVPNGPQPMSFQSFDTHPLLLSHEKQASAAGPVTCL